MSPVRKPRRVLRDEEAGLAFSWRIPTGSTTRLACAVLLAAGLFAGAASVFQVKGKSGQVANREAARVMALFPDDPSSRELLDHAKQHSPFPDRWHPDVNEALQEQVDLVTAELVERARYEPLLRPIPEAKLDFSLPGLYDPARPRLPKPPGDGGVARPQAVIGGVEVRAVPDGPLRERWGSCARVWDGEAGPKLLGREATFVVFVAPDGMVESCLVVEGIESKLDLEIVQWLRGHRAAADESAGTPIWDLVRVAGRPVARTGGEVKP